MTTTTTTPRTRKPRSIAEFHLWNARERIDTLTSSNEALRAQNAELRAALEKAVTDIEALYDTVKDGKRVPVFTVGMFRRLSEARATLARVKP